MSAKCTGPGVWTGVASTLVLTLLLSAICATSAVAGAGEDYYPPWQHGTNNDAADRGLEFTVPDVDNLADFHGDPRDPLLVLFVGGNYYFAMAPLVHAFEARHPQLEGRLYWETLPPGLLVRQMKAGGRVTVGNMTWTVKPDVYLAGMQAVNREIDAGLLASPAVPYVTNTLTIMVPKGNPARVTGLVDLGRPALRLAMPNPQFEGIARQIRDSLRKAGGDALAERVYERKVQDGTTRLTQIHHRQTPLWIMQAQVDAGVTWKSEAIFQEQSGHPIEHVDIPDAQNTVGVYAGAVVKHAPHARAAEEWLAFIRSPDAVAIFERYGFKPYVASGGNGASAVPACAACHGRAGEGNAAAGFPRLAGLPAKYLAAQLDAMASGIRQSAVMGPLAHGLREEDRMKWAGYYAALPPIRASKLLGTPSSAGAQLALHGRWPDGIPACVRCHGSGGSGVGSAFPALAGQSATYLANQLHAWKLGTRRGEPLDLMQSIAKRLSDEDIRFASDYFASAAGSAPSPAPPADRTKQPTRHGFSRAAGVSTFTPSDKPIPDDDFGKVAELGRRIFDDPAKYAGPYVGNDLRCSNCHLDEGRLAGSAPMWAAYVSYPAYRAKNHHVNTFAERLQGCFRYSMNGKAPPLGNAVLVALESYAYWMAQGAPLDPNIAGRGYSKVAKPALPPDYHRGAEVYARTCALCHGAGGAGQRDNEGNPAFPALWGTDSFNWGAGMSSVATAAAFIEADMPFGRGGTLSIQDAWDVALFVDGHERPQDPRYTGSVAETQARFHDHDDSMYGRTVNGYVLGSNAVPPGPRHPTRR